MNSTESTSPPQSTALANWSAHGVHEVTLSSNTKVKIKLPNLPALLKSGEIPAPLVEVALGFQNAPPKITEELIASQVDFTRYLISKTVVEPAIGPDDVPAIPYEDQEMLMEFATRQRDMDATGRHMAGVEVVEDFNTFRG